MTCIIFNALKQFAHQSQLMYKCNITSCCNNYEKTLHCPNVSTETHPTVKNMHKYLPVIGTL